MALNEWKLTEKHIMAVLDGKWMDSEVQIGAQIIQILNLSLNFSSLVFI